MEFLVILSVIGSWLLYGVIIKLTKKRKHDYSLLVAFVFLLGLGYFYFYNDYESIKYTVFSYTTVALFAFWLIIDNSLLLFKKNVSEFDFYDLEEEIKHLSGSFDLLRLRFISTIELLNDGISFRDEDTVFGTDKYIEIIGLKSNEYTFNKYIELIHKDDLYQYNQKLEKLTKKNPVYTIKYRVKKDGRYIWINEHGKLIFINSVHRFFLSLKILLEANYKFQSSIMNSSILLNNQYLLDKITTLNKRIQNGDTISSAFEETGLFDELILRLISTGEKSNALRLSVSECEKIYKQKLDERIKLFSSLIEPIFIVIIMLLIVWVVLAVLVPLWGIGEVIKV